MSEGSADRLYLALRVAALADYLSTAHGLPFIGGDLFINFDNGRAQAGLKVLGRLARQFQLIFFTHYEHLVDIAERALDGKARVWHLRA